MTRPSEVNILLHWDRKWWTTERIYEPKSSLNFIYFSDCESLFIVAYFVEMTIRRKRVKCVSAYLEATIVNRRDPKRLSEQARMLHGKILLIIVENISQDHSEGAIDKYF